jgi:hypothetical protein
VAPHNLPHAVLARISTGYPPHQGRLSTCYSPVRHSTTPSRKRKVASSDLHVLRTPPAFVLSQDQTRHARKFPPPVYLSAPQLGVSSLSLRALPLALYSNLLGSACDLIGHLLLCTLYSRSHCYPLHTLCYCFSLFSCSGSPAALPPLASMISHWTQSRYYHTVQPPSSLTSNQTG